MWASEALFSAQITTAGGDDGCVPDMIHFGGDGSASVAGGVNNPSGAYCTFPEGSPLPRPKCCDTGDCAKGSMDNVACEFLPRSDGVSR